MADIRLAKPAAGASESVQCAPDARFVFDFPATDATLAREGDNLNISFQDGGRLQLQGFYQEYNGENLPSFTIDGTEVAAADFFEAMNEPDLMPAAGPATGTVANGARFHEWGDSSLAAGITHLTGLDWGFSRSFEWEDHPNAVGYDGGVDNPVSIVPGNPWTPGPDIPEMPGLNASYNPDGPNMDAHTPRSAVRVHEKSIGTPDAVQHESLIIHAPDGVATITVGGVAVWQNGRLAPEGARTFPTDEGRLVVTGFDPATGRLSYSFELTDPTTEHGRPGEDSISHSFKVTVTDTDGDTASNYISVIVVDDVPLAVDDHRSVKEAGRVDGSVLDNDDHGKDGPGAFGENGPAVRWQVPDGASRGVDEENGRPYYEVKVNEGTARLYDDGSYIFTAKDLDADTQVSFNYAIVDADGDESPATLTIDVKTNTPGITTDVPEPDPDPTPDDPEPGHTTSNNPSLHEGHMIMDEGDLPAAGVQPAGTGQAGEYGKHGYAGTGHIHVNLNDDTSGSIQIGDVEIAIENHEATLPENATHNTGIGVTITVTDVAFNEETGKWDVTYEYKLTKAQEHPNEEAAGEKDSLEETVPILVTDASGDTAKSELTVEVHDDAPVITESAKGDDFTGDNVIKGSTLSGTFAVNFGADGPADTPFMYGDTAFKADSEAPGTWVATITQDGTELGELRLTVAEGGGTTYKFEPAVPVLDTKVTLHAVDGDGDKTPVTISLKLDHNPDIIEEKPRADDPKDVALIASRTDLDEGDQPDHADDTPPHASDNFFTVNLYGEDGTITIGGEKGFEISIKDGEPIVPVNAEYTTANGVTLSGFDVEPDEDGWKISYKAAFTGDPSKADTDPHKGLDHAAARPGGYTVDGSGHNAQALVDIRVVDSTKGEKPGVIVVNVHDDKPLVVKTDLDPSTITETSQTGITIETSAFFTEKEGADGLDHKQTRYSLDIAKAETELRAIRVVDDGTGHDLGTVTLSRDGDVITGKAGGVDVFTISMDTDGTVTVKMTGDATLHHQNEGKDTLAITGIRVTKTVVDTDGDDASATVDLTINVSDFIPEANHVHLQLDHHSFAAGNVLDTDDFSADGRAVASPDPEANFMRWNVIESEACTRNEDGSWTLSMGNSAVVRLNTDGSYTVKTGDMTNMDELGISIPYTIRDADGDLANATLNITVPGYQDPATSPGLDPTPIVGGEDHNIIISNTDFSSSETTIRHNYNIALVLDKSGSMIDNKIGGEGEDSSKTRWEVLTASVQRLLEQYDAYVEKGYGNINVQLVFFNRYVKEDEGDIITITSDQFRKSGSQAVLDAIASFPKPTGATNYEVALTTANQWFQAMQGNGYTNKVLFLTDGEPTAHIERDDSDTNGTKVDVKDWTQGVAQFQKLVDDEFVTRENIHIIGIGQGATVTYRVEGGGTETGNLADYGQFTEVKSAQGLQDALEGANKTLFENLPEADLIYGNTGDDIIFGDGVDLAKELGDTDPNTWARLIQENPARLDISLDADEEAGKQIDRADIILGGSGNDILYGQGGNDLLIGDGENSQADEGILHSLETSYCEGNVSADAIIATLKSGGEGKVSALEALIQASENRETDGNDLLFGGTGDDVLLGMGGDDYLKGGDGRDVLFGGSGNDILVYHKDDLMENGGSDVDILLAGSGVPSLQALLNGKGKVSVPGEEDKMDVPIVSKVEMLLTTPENENVECLGITSRSGLANHGIYMAGGRVFMDESKWILQDAQAGWPPTVTYTYKAGETDTGSADEWANISIELQVLHSVTLFRLSAEEYGTLMEKGPDHLDVEDFAALTGINNLNGAPATSGDDVLFSGQISGATRAALMTAYAGVVPAEASLEELLDAIRDKPEIAFKVLEEQKGDNPGSHANVFGGGGHDVIFGQNSGEGSGEVLMGDGDLKEDLVVKAMKGFGDSVHKTLIKLQGDDEDALATISRNIEADVEPNEPNDGRDGNDTIYGFGGTDLIYGGGGDDRIYGGDGEDILVGGSGDDEIHGGDGNDFLFGGSGDDYLHGGAGRDVLFGGSGDDVIIFDAEDYFIDGGDGLDILLAGNTTLTLQKMMENYENRGNDGLFEKGTPMVHDVEVMIKGIDTSSLTKLSELEDYNIFIEKSDDGRDQIILKEGWTGQGGTYINEHYGLTMETNNLTEFSNEEMITLQMKINDSGVN